MYSALEVPKHSQSGWCFEMVFWMIWVLKTPFYLTFVRRNSVTIWRQKSCDTRFRRYPSILTLWFHYLFCIFCKFWNQGQTLAYQSKTIENNIMNLYIFWKLKKISNKIWKRKSNNIAMEIYRSLNIVAKVVKNTKISTLS